MARTSNISQTRIFAVVDEDWHVYAIYRAYGQKDALRMYEHRMEGSGAPIEDARCFRGHGRRPTMTLPGIGQLQAHAEYAVCKVKNKS